QNSVYSENLALLTGATHFTMSSAREDDKLIQSASRAIHALNHRPPTAGMSLDEVGGTSELEGCEEFYHPAGGWTDGWRDVAKTLKSAQRLAFFWRSWVLPDGSCAAHADGFEAAAYATGRRTATV
ncbi:unnamed protein product, partial [Symbiodinium necroappetens]